MDKKHYCTAFEECDKREYCKNHAIHIPVEKIEDWVEIDSGRCIANGYIKYWPTKEGLRKGVK